VSPAPSTSLLEGFGAGLVREAALAARVQCGLERLYRLEQVAPVGEYMQHARDGEREALLVREAADGAVEIVLRVPMLGAREIPLHDSRSLEPLCQIIEGVSHFVMLTQRAHWNAPTTQLELELQAEVDKYVVLAASLPAPNLAASETLRDRLYERVSYEHDAGSERGDRYRLANRMAARYTRSLEQRFLSRQRFSELQHELRRFFHASREEKLRVADAA